MPLFRALTSSERRSGRARAAGLGSKVFRSTQTMNKVRSCRRNVPEQAVRQAPRVGTVAKLKNFCLEKGVFYKRSAKKAELQRALRAWAAAHPEGEMDEEGSVSEEGSERDPTEDLDMLPVVGGNNFLPGPEVNSRAGSSVSPKSLFPEELEDKREERKLRLELTKMEKEQALARLEKEQALEEKRLTMKERKLTHELSLKELDIRAWQVGAWSPIHFGEDVNLLPQCVLNRETPSLLLF
ncbi:hypothetical protein NDU88_001362 [Pleurodeles waltl]|uniref:Uncharacterized protein n=1 Tax=Pleurodeles waltl TaxID=8319 RepID=A0AAV7WLX7_PLEWA|nr:hypothetical protein NDU88_001362 [Pleurodeles waltl]